MAFRQPIPNFSAAVRHPDQMENLLRDFHERMQKLEKHTSTQAVSSQKRAPVTERPPRAALSVSGTKGKGRWVVTIRNPEFGNTAGTGRITPKPIYHHLEYSTDANFSPESVTKLEPSHQTYFPIVHEPNQTLYFRLRSSYDGVNFNLPQVTSALG